MAKKKLLNETQVRRFMGLAGIQPLKEMYGKKMEEDEMNEAGAMYEEEDLAEAGTYMEDEPAADDESEMAADEPEMAADEPAEDEVSVDKETIDNAGNAIMALLGQLGYESGAAEMDDMPADDDLGAEMPDMGDEDEEAEEDAEEVIKEALSGVNIELSNDEVVQEVARRVAKRILKAKEAQKRLDEALGNKPVRRASRFNKTQK